MTEQLPSEQLATALRNCGLCQSSGYDPVPNEDGTQADCRRCGGRQSLEWLAAAELDRLQARVDALMLEFCPNEMTALQMQRWAANQKQVST